MINTLIHQTKHGYEGPKTVHVPTVPGLITRCVSYFRPNVILF